MAVTVIDPAEGALSKALAGLGKAVSERIYATNIKEKEILDDIDLVRGHAAGYRAAVAAGHGDTYLNSIGVGPEFGEQHLVAFPETYLEQLERARVQGGVGTAAGEIEGLGLDVEQASLQALLDSGTPGWEAKARALVAQGSVQNIEALMASGVYESEAAGRAAHAKMISDTAADFTQRDILRAKFDIEEMQQLMDLGVISMEARGRYATAEMTIAEWAALKEAGTLGQEAYARRVAAESSMVANRLIAEQSNIQLGQLDLYKQALIADYGVRAYEGKRTEAFLAANLPEIEAEFIATEAAFKTDTFDAFRALGGIRLQALGDTQELRASREQNLYNAAYYTVLNANGVPKIRADLERTSALLEQAEVTFNKEQLKYYIDAMNDVDQTTPEGRQFVQIANAYIVNPGFGQFLGAEVARDAAARAAQPTPQELILESAQVQEELDTRLKTLIEARAGKGDDKRSDEDIAAFAQSYNNMVDGVRELVRKGSILPLDLTYYDIEEEALVPEKFTSTFSMEVARDFARALDQSASAIPMADRNAYRVATIEQALANFDTLANEGDWDSRERRDMEEFLHTALEISREAPTLRPVAQPRTIQTPEGEVQLRLPSAPDHLAPDLFWIQEQIGQSGLPITRNIQSPLGPNPPE
jgi:hypothetical protein